MLFLFNDSKFSFGITDLIVLLITVISLFIFRYYFLYFTQENPLLGPFPLPLVGSFFGVKEDLSKYLLGVQQKYGDLTEVWFANLRIILTTRKDYMEKFLSSSTKSKLRMLAKIVFEKINFGKQFQIHNIFHIKDHQKTT